MKRELDLALSYDLCSAPTGRGSASGEKRATRVALTSTHDFSGLVIKKPDYERQYASIYFSRLRQLRAVLVVSSSAPVRDQLIKVQLNEECWVMGTVFRDMVRPSALDAYNDVPVAVKDCYAGPEDKFVIEDETGRASLTGEGLSELVTGLVVALRCVEQQSGELLVKEILYPGVAPLFKAPAVSSSAGGASGCLGFVSGKLDGLAGELLAEFLCGSLGAPRSLGMSASVGRLVLLGNAVGSEGNTRSDVKHHHQALSAHDEQLLLAPVARLDLFLARLCGSIPVDLLPGPLDPAAQCLPQQPLSSVLFAQASKWKSLNCVTNPYRATVGAQQQLLACSGQPLDNLLKFSTITSRLDAACSTLRWRHLCPTAPDTLACYPCEEDPFVMNNSPHILAFGNQPQFETRTVKDTTVLLVPSFESSGLLVLYNLATKHISTINKSAIQHPGDPAHLGFQQVRKDFCLMIRAAAFAHAVQVLESAEHLIFGQGAKTAEEEAWWLVEHLACPVVSREKLDKMLKRRLDGEPMAYITEKVRLVGLDFKCDARAIIPRSYIAELLADKSLLEHFVAPPKRALDLCCGNANLAIAALVRMPSLVSCTASDLSDHALALAAENVKTYKLQKKLKLIKSDLFVSLKRQKFDLILCNPPYVKQSVRLPKEYLAEPALALKAGSDGLDVVRAVLPQLSTHLEPGGFAVMEVGFGQMSRMRKLWPSVLFPETSAGRGPVAIFKM